MRSPAPSSWNAAVTVVDGSAETGDGSGGEGTAAGGEAVPRQFGDITMNLLATTEVTERAGANATDPTGGTSGSLLDAVPTAVMTALVAPALVTHGPAEVVALVCAGLIALRAPLMVSVAIGLIALMGLRVILG